jgi:glycosyltransferase involved in cell wall biosynthesis
LINHLGLPTNKIFHIPNPIDIPAITQLSQADFSHPWFQPGEPPVLLALGRLTEQKDFSTLLRAFALLRGSSDARLMIIGDGPQRKDLETLANQLDIASHVQMPGFMPNPYPYLKRAAMLVLSSRWEGMPSVILEALALGVPIVSTDCQSGPSEILMSGRFGTLVPVGDVTSLADALKNTLAATLSVKFSETLKKRASDFEPQHLSDRYLRLLIAQ